ncbi:MAG: glycosyltransferase [Deltaproteobacteria bacterium]|nr:glycosyltransferase [Deltaproteobacteria bacterium]
MTDKASLRAKAAIVHDYLNQRGGAERVVAVFHEIYPDAPIFTSIVDYGNIWKEMEGADIRPTWMQRLPGIMRHFKKYLPFYPGAIESIDLSGYDIVISSSSAFAKGALKAGGALHICYCYTPMRFVWDTERYLEKEGMGLAARTLLPFFLRRLKAWDLRTKTRPDYYIAISTAVKRRIEEFYGLPAAVIFPPVDCGRFKPGKGFEDFYLIVSRLNAYKRIELAVEAAGRLGVALKVVGDGPYKEALVRMAKPNVEFLGRLDDAAVARLYARCKALIFPGAEDFGIVPLEANAAGRPVIAYKDGGALNTVVDGATGYFFDRPTPEALMEAIERMEAGAGRFDPERLRAHALRFDRKVFVEKFGAFVDEKYAEMKRG